MADYNFRDIEKKQQRYWEENRTYKADNHFEGGKTYVDFVKSLDDMDKLKVYLHYFAANTALKNSFEVVDKKPLDKRLSWNHDRGLPDKECEGIAFYFLWKNQRIMSFDEFISAENVKITDHGEDWERQGRAQRVTVRYTGIYDWFWKFFEGEFAKKG